MSEQYLEIHKNDLESLGSFYDVAKRNLELAKKVNKMSKKELSSFEKPANVLLELTILSIIRDRQKSSINNKRFKDKNGRSYIIFTYDEIIKKLHCTGRSCTKALNDLKSKGFISVQRTFNGPTKYYIESSNYKDGGYYKLYYKYFDEFNNNLKYIYAYMIIKDMESLSKYETLNEHNSYRFIDENGKYFVAMNTLNLSNKLKCSLPTCGKIIQYLENNGYIKRRQRKNTTSRIYLMNKLVYD